MVGVGGTPPATAPRGEASPGTKGGVRGVPSATAQWSFGGFRLRLGRGVAPHPPAAMACGVVIEGMACEVVMQLPGVMMIGALTIIVALRGPPRGPWGVVAPPTPPAVTALCTVGGTGGEGSSSSSSSTQGAPAERDSQAMMIACMTTGTRTLPVAAAVGRARGGGANDSTHRAPRWSLYLPLVSHRQPLRCGVGHEVASAPIVTAMEGGHAAAAGRIGAMDRGADEGDDAPVVSVVLCMWQWM